VKLANHTIFILHDKRNVGSMKLFRLRPPTAVEEVVEKIQMEAVEARIKKAKHDTSPDPVLTPSELEYARNLHRQATA